MKYILSLLTLVPLLALSQCDLEIYNFHPETLETTIIIHNGYGCNPNDPTDDVITKFILGITSTELQADNFQCGLTGTPEGWILQNYITDFVLWDDDAAYLGPDGVLSTGDTLTFNLFDAQVGESFAETCYQSALDLGYFDDCIELYIWQINCSNDILGTNLGEDNCVDNEDNGYEYPDVTPENNIFSDFCGPSCDVNLIGFDPETNTVSISVINGENCGCNEFTQIDGNTCGPSSSSTVNNNEYINNLVFGLHYDNIWANENTNCTQTNFHPGWAFAYPVENIDAYTGDTLTFELNTSFNWDCVNTTPIEGECWELVVWQINLSQTANIEDFPTEYWTDTCGTCANQTQMYPDIDLSNNTLSWCPDELPPPPLVEGCTDENATNYDPNADVDDDSCEYPPILGCTFPTACNYNQFATENDGSCAFCDTPNGEEICNEYHNSEDYWDWYVNLFNCEVDHQVDSVYFVEAGCDLLGPQFCQPMLKFNIDHTNVGDLPIDSWNFTYWSGDWIVTTAEYGVNFNNGEGPYAVSLPAGQNGNTINVFVFSGFEWEEGDTLWVESAVIGNQIDGNLTNNLNYFILPEYPVCELGCMDSTAVNFNPNATCGDDSCEYPLPEITYIDYECNLNCNDTLAWYDAVTWFENVGNAPITSFCIEWDIIGFNQEYIECFEGELLPGEDIILEFSLITSDGGGGVVIRLLELNGEETDITWFQPTSCYQDAFATCIFGCTDPEASNYNPAAEWDDGSCDYSIYGCTDATALNYNPTANVDDGSCIYDILGCTDPAANNYNPLATINDGSCTYDILGCTDPNALNYNPAANVDDGSCEYPIPGCTDPAALNYNEFATVEDGSCEYLEGCTDPEAINYNSLAILDDGSCVYPPEGCDGSYYAPNTFTPNNDGVNDGWTVVVADPDCWRTWNMQIYNRWGGLVWESDKVGEIWPGSVFDGDHYVADGVYLYKVIGTGWDPDITFKTTGHITIFR
jgi:gliding motility-associated-like protein